MKAPRSLKISSPSIAVAQPSSPDASHRPSRSPYRFLAPQAEEYDEKDICDGQELSALKPSRSGAAVPCSSRIRLDSSPAPADAHRRSQPSTPIVINHAYGYPAPSRTLLPAPCTMPTESQSPSAWCRFMERIRPWIPLGLWVATSLGFLLAIAFWRSEVFQRLDEFSHWLQDQGYRGHAVLFVLIFITTIPPFPLYSTFMTLSGYCFGALSGALISYFASLSGAIVVFLLSREYLSDYIGSIFARAPSLKRVVRAIEKRPNILFLVRLAPYPYNVMNVLLAASPTLTLRTYATCTGLSLFKVIVHTSIGAGIHSFSHQVSATPAEGVSDPEDQSSVMSKVWTGLGVALCVGVFIYNTIVARRAVDGELADSEEPASEETVAFLHADDSVDDLDNQEMTETTIHGGTTPSQPRMAALEMDGPDTTDIVASPLPRA